MYSYCVYLKPSRVLNFISFTTTIVSPYEHLHGHATQHYKISNSISCRFIADTNQLKILDIQPEDEGVFVCEVTEGSDPKRIVIAGCVIVHGEIFQTTQHIMKTALEVFERSLSTTITFCSTECIVNDTSM